MHFVSGLCGSCVAATLCLALFPPDPDLAWLILTSRLDLRPASSPPSRVSGHGTSGSSCLRPLGGLGPDGAPEGGHSSRVEQLAVVLRGGHTGGHLHRLPHQEMETDKAFLNQLGKTLQPQALAFTGDFNHLEGCHVRVQVIPFLE